VRPELLNEPHATESRYVQDALRDLAVEHNAHFLVGAFSPLPPDYGYVITPGVATRIPAESWKLRYNSGYLLDPSGQYVDRYDKIHLVPFGEYIPLPHIFPFLAKLVPFDASLTAGDRRTIFNVNGSKFGVLICYEDTDSEMARRLRRDGADFLVNISNDAWFGSSELDQHFVPARFRAIENRVGVIRSGNNGITGVIDPLGRVGPVLPKNGIAAIVDTVETTGSRTLYSRIGDWPGVLAALAVVVVQALRRFPK
jgi:apolipoprotein N-acyltransferase